MKKIITIIIILMTAMNARSQQKESVVLIQTNMGDIKVKLYNETPKHRDNFLKLVEEGVYQDLLFHRVIEDFMIQGGNPASRNMSDSAFLDKGDLGYMVDAEFCAPLLYHRRGVVAAARLGDNVNPEQASSASQFYIVTGKAVTDSVMDKMEEVRLEALKLKIQQRLQAENTDKIKELYKQGNRTLVSEFREQLMAQAQEEAETRKGEVMFSDEQRDAYRVIGGVPHLDGAYTVFGEVIEGMITIDLIEKMETNQQDRPMQNVVMSISLIE